MISIVDTLRLSSKEMNHRCVKSKIISLYGGDTWGDPNDGSLWGFETLTEIMVFTVCPPVYNKEDINQRSLKSRIISLCGGDTWSEIILLEKFRVKIARRATNPQLSSSTIKIQNSHDDGSLLGI